MLLLRVLTASVLATIILAAVFFLPTLGFYFFMAVIILIAAWEWANLAGITSTKEKILYLVYLTFLILIITFWTQLLEIFSELLNWPDLKKQSGLIEWLVILPVFFWVMIVFLIRKVPESLLNLKLSKAYKKFIGIFILFFAWMFFVKLRAYYGPEAAFYFLLLIWMADISAYFAGKTFGKEKLAPNISPGKTVQGMYGAIVSSVICSVGLALYYGYPFMIATDFGLLSILTVLVSIYGDLFFSIVKRQSGVKDSGKILPGHGGILDRIDSIVAAAPFYYAGVILVGRSVFS